MRLATLAATACACCCTAHALVVGRQANAPRVINLSTQRDNSLNVLNKNQMLQRDMATSTLDNQRTLYFVNATLGTPEQSVRLHLDTGSSDLWVNTPSSMFCSIPSNKCALAGTYSPNSSSTYEYIGDWFNISYVDGTGAVGDYATDTFSLSDVSLTDFQFGIGYTSSGSQGILGIGYPANEVQVSRAKKPAYNNLPFALKSSGLTATAAYSLYLNDLDASTGSILFGGVDTDQYEGTLATLPVQKKNGKYTELFVTLTAVSLSSVMLGSDMALAVLLDSGSTLTFLPDDMASKIFSMTDAVYDDNESVAFVPCSLADSTATLNFTFSGPTIVVAMKELVLDIFSSSGDRVRFPNGENACMFGIAPTGAGTNVLGDTFLRSAYVVYDLDNNEISLAQSAFNATTSNVIEITSAGVPGASAVSNPVAATTGIALVDDDGSSSGSSTGRLVAASSVRVLAIVAAAVAGFCVW